MPEPCRPAISTTVGGRDEKITPADVPPISFVSSSRTILTTCWPGFSSCDFGSQRLLLHRRRELLDDLEIDVRLQQGKPDLAHGAVDVVVGQGAALPDALERLLKFLGQGVEHAW